MPVTDSWRNRFEREFSRAVAAFFASEQDATVKAARKKEIYRPEDEELRRVLEPWLIAVSAKGAEVAGEPLIAIGMGFDTALVNEAAVRYAYERSAQAVTQINETTRRQIQQAVGDWIASGDKIDELTATLQRIGVFDYNRAEMIAVTEVTDVLAGSEVRSWLEVNRQYGTDVIEGHQWVCSNDEYTCPACSALGGLTWSDDGAVPASIEQQELKGVTASLDGKFVHPGGTGLQKKFEGQSVPRPPWHPRCRCSTRPVFSS